MEKGNRLMSLDALRGFDMFFITGGSGLISALCGAFGNSHCWLAKQMGHVAWAGLAHHDTIFPLFLFLAGVSWPFSYASQVEKGRSALQIHLKVVLRMLILATLGMMIGGLLRFNPPFRIPSVLGQIGLSWGIAAMIFMHVKKPLVRGLVIGGILVAYWLVLAFVGAPDAPAGADFYSKQWNIVSWLDRTLMPNYIYVKNVYDPESLFCVPAGAALAMLGMTAGSILRLDAWKPGRRAAVLLGLSLATLAAAFFFIYVLRMPIVKALWTSSFVLSAAAYSFAMLALFYWIVDVRGWRRWTFYFRVIGMNSITVYMMMAIGIVGAFRAFFFGGLVAQFSGPWKAVASNAAFQLAAWLLLYILYRKKAFLKV